MSYLKVYLSLAILAYVVVSSDGYAKGRRISGRTLTQKQLRELQSLYGPKKSLSRLQVDEESEEKIAKLKLKGRRFGHGRSYHSDSLESQSDSLSSESYEYRQHGKAFMARPKQHRGRAVQAPAFTSFSSSSESDSRE